METYNSSKNNFNSICKMMEGLLALNEKVAHAPDFPAKKSVLKKIRKAYKSLGKAADLVYVVGNPTNFTDVKN